MTSQDLRELNLAARHLVPSARLLLVVLGTFADRHALAWPSRDLLREHTGLKDRHLRETLGVLKREGFLQEVGEGWRVLMPPATGGATAPENGGTAPEARRYSAGQAALQRRASGATAPDTANIKGRTIEEPGKVEPQPPEGGIFDLPEKRETNVDIFAIPTLAEVLAFAALPTSAITPDAAHDYFDKSTAVGWVDMNGRPLRDWRADFRLYARSRNARRARLQGPARPTTGGELMRSYAGTAQVPTTPAPGF